VPAHREAGASPLGLASTAVSPTATIERLAVDGRYNGPPDSANARAVLAHRPGALAGLRVG
jgi:hypothetical protein